MKVANQNSTGASGPGRPPEIQSTRNGGAAAARARSSATGDSVDFSSTLGILSRAMESYTSDRNTQVQALATEYQNGTYQVDSAATSRSMISDALSG